MVLVRHTDGRGRPRVVRGHGAGGRHGARGPTGPWRPLGAWAAALVRALVLLAWAGAASNPAQAQAQAQAPAEGRPQTCRIGVNVEDLYDIDTAADTFGALLWVWSLCPTAELDPLADVAFPTASSIDPGELESVDTGGAGHYRYRRVQGTFRHDYDVARYPFDRHRVVIPIDETRQGASVVVFEADTAGSFLTPDILQKRHEWRVSDFAVAASVSEEAETYGLPNVETARYARAEASFALARTGLLTFLKLTTGVFAAAFIALMTFFYDPRDAQGFGRRLGLLVGALFGVLINMRTADTVIGDTGRLTLVTEIHLAALALIVVLAALALRDWWRFESALPLAYPNWTELAATGGLFALATAGLMARAAW